MHPTQINDKKEPTKANGCVAVRNQSSPSRKTLSEKAICTLGGGKPPRPLCAFKSGYQSRHYVVVCFHRKMECISMLWDLGMCQVQLQVYSDASGSWGCAAVQDHHWLQLKWTPKFQHLSIAIKELIPVVLAAATFGYQWSGKVVQFVVDNSAVVEVVKSTYSKEPHPPPCVFCSQVQFLAHSIAYTRETKHPS